MSVKSFIDALNSLKVAQFVNEENGRPGLNATVNGQVFGISRAGTDVLLEDGTRKFVWSGVAQVASVVEGLNAYDVRQFISKKNGLPGLIATIEGKSYFLSFDGKMSQPWSRGTELAPLAQPEAVTA